MKIFSKIWNEKFKEQGLTPPSSAIGDIKASMLTEAQLNDSDWVLMDGRPVPESAYETLTGNANVPDVRGQFLRGFDNGSGIDAGRTFGSTQTDSTKVPNTGFTTASAGSHTHSSNAYRSGTSNSNATRLQGWGTSDSGTYTIGSAGAHTHAVTGGDSETRPTNVAVNYFIKVN